MLCAILQAIKGKTINPNVAILFSRSEEKGEMGSYFAAADTPISIKTNVISTDITPAENKKSLGKGLLFRTSNKRTAYDMNLLKSLVEKAKEYFKDTNFKYELKKEKDKGATDSSAFDSLGFKVAGIAIPLWNYHNKDPKTGKPLPEIVHDFDLQSLVYYIRCLICEVS